MTMTATQPPPDHDWGWTSDGRCTLADLARSHARDVATLLRTAGSHGQTTSTFVD